MHPFKAFFNQPLTTPVMHNLMAGGITTALVASGALVYQLIVGAAGGCPEKYVDAAKRGEKALLENHAHMAMAIADDLLDQGANCGCIYILKSAASAQVLKAEGAIGAEMKARLESDCRKYASRAKASPFEQPRAEALADSCSAEANLVAWND